MESLIRAWGRIGTSGQSRIAWFATEAEALAVLNAIESAKRRRGYCAKFIDKCN